MDYNIYIHDKTSQTKPTQPRTGGGSFTTPKGNSSQQASSGSSQGGLASAASSFLGKIPKGVGVAAIVIWAIKKTIQTADKVITSLVTPQLERQGDFRFNVTYSNIKGLYGNLTNPIGAFISDYNRMKDIQVANRKINEEKLLLGDTFINSYNRKV